MQYLLYIALSFAFVLYACVPPQNESDTRSAASSVDSTATADKDIILEGDTLAYRIAEIKHSSPYLNGDANHPDTTFYRAQYPIFAIDRINKLTREAIFLEGDTDPNDAAQAFIDGYNEFVEDENTQYITSWVKDMECSVVLNTAPLLSICTQLYEYTGGAHGHTVKIWSNFDVLEMRKLTLNDLIDEAQLPKLTQLAEEKFRATEGIAADSPLEADYFFADGIFALNDNFGWTEKELIFYYNEYEIKPYAKGSTAVRIPYEELEHILNARGHKYLKSIKKQVN